MALIFKSVLCLTIIFCVVANEIPSPPEIVETICMRWTAILRWFPTGEAPVTDYIIQYQTNWVPDQWIDYEFAEHLKQSNVRLILSPWANYTFRVIARNTAGVSLPSSPSQECVTDEDIPYKNPELVYGRGNGPNNLVISWTPMRPIYQNAPGFYYKVYWRQNDDLEDQWHQKIISEWEQHKLVIENLPKLRPFRIKVEAYNSMGKAKEDAQEVIGYSDEDKPTEAPKNFRVLETRDGKSAKLSWEPVSPFSINGHFKGYKVQSWTENDENKTEKIVPANVTTAFIDIFTPGQLNNAQVLAFNGAFDGPPSDTIELTMPEDVYPDPPSFIWTRVTDQNNKAVIRITSEPNFINKNPGKKVYIQYRRKDASEQWESTVQENSEDAKQPVDLVNLEFDTFYEIRVVAKSGKFESFSNISVIDTGVTKWPKPSTTTTTTTTTPEPTLPPTEVVAKPVEDFYPDRSIDTNKPIDDNIEKNNPEIAGNPEELDENNNFAKTPWFIALLCVLAFICAFIGVFIFIKKRRGSEEVIKRNGNARTDTIRDVSPRNTIQNSEPNESNHFIIPVDNNIRNGSVGHDEGDSHDEEDYEVRVYNQTTKPKV